MIKIEKIEFKNYRQYKDITIIFNNKNSDNNIHILRAKNGTGKTTFLNGILWCLYEKEYYINDISKALKVVNETAIQEAEIDDVVETNVKMTLLDEEKRIIFERSLKFTVATDPISEMKKAVQMSPTATLKVMELPINAFENAKVYESDEDTKGIVKQYFDEDIYFYYFFDGENLPKYFDKENGDKVKKSIFTLSQVNLLEIARTRTETMSIEKSRELTKKNNNDDVKIYDLVDKLKDEIEQEEKENASLKKDIPVLELRIKELDEQLAGYKPVQNKQARRAELEAKYKRLKQEQTDFLSKRKEFIRTYLTLFNLYPRIKSTLDMIKYKEDHGELPPRIDKKQIEELINNHEANCPMCDGELNDHAILHMKQLLEELDVSSQASNYLSSIKGGLENAILKCQKYPKEHAKIIENERYYSEELDKTEEELDTISKYLSEYADSNTTFSVSKLEKLRSDTEDELKTRQHKLWDNERLLDINSKKLEELEAQVKELEKNANEKMTLKKQISVLRLLTSSFDEVKKNLMDEIKKDIEINTWNSFKNMMWKKETFHSLIINDDYQMTVYNNNLNIMTESLSATEKMALAYSFTLAIHETSGRNCPLVVDSPLGRVSDDNRINMAKELLHISKNKQIIMLFTPDEYSEEVAQIYDNTVASIRNIYLSKDEKEIESVEN